MKLAMIGCGNMGSAYIKSLLKNNILSTDDLLLVDKSEDRVKQLQEEKMAAVVSTDIPESIKEYDIIVIAVKPQYFKDMSEELVPFLQENQIAISIMAGITIDFMQQTLSHEKVVRAMPNTPCQIGYGITSYFAAKELTDKDLESVDVVLKSTGKTQLFEDESLLDAATALAGSAPAYFFNIIKQMVDAGEEMGVERDVAKKLAMETMLGSYHLINHSGEDLQDLIDKVTSKGGTTIAAITKMKDEGLDEAIKKGLFAARNRGKELAKGS